jgi:RNA polymerase sigma-70 factor (ECF subfamily)
MSDDRTLSTQATRGDATALQRLLHKHARPLLSYIRRSLPHQLAASVDPADVLQDVYLEAFRRIGSLRVAEGADASLYPWLSTVARRRIAYLYRRHRRAKGRARAVTEVDLGRDSVVMLIAELAVDTHTPSKMAARRELASGIADAIDGLPARHREAVRLRYLEGMPAIAVAARLGTSEHAVHNICGRAMIAMRRQLQYHR